MATVAGRPPSSGFRRSLWASRNAMTHRSTRVVAVLALVALLLTGARGSAQIQWAIGQNVAPIFEGWIRNSDGSFDMVFGYLNRNWEEVLNIPVGPDNHVQPDGPDRGQPTVFVPRRIAQPPGERREQFVFRVRVSKDWKPDQELVWSVTAHGRTDRAIATLNPLEEMDNGVIAMNRGASISADGNEPPSVRLSSARETATISDAVQLTAIVSDDGLPSARPRPPSGPGPGASAAASAARAAAPGRISGLHVRWIQYRGPGTITFTPDRTPIDAVGKVSGAKVSTLARFSEPGTYVLRAFADDSSLFATADVTVRVDPDRRGGGGRP